MDTILEIFIYKKMNFSKHDTITLKTSSSMSPKSPIIFRHHLTIINLHMSRVSDKINLNIHFQPDPPPPVFPPVPLIPL